MPPLSNLITEDFFDVSFESRYYSYYTCLNELCTNLKKLKPLLESDLIGEARMILHQMKGTANVLKNKTIIEDLANLHHAVKNPSESVDSIHFLKILASNLSNTYAELNIECEYINVLIFDGSFNSKIITDSLKEASFIKNVESIHDPFAIRNVLYDFMPDIFLIIQNEENRLNLDEIESIRLQFPGSTVYLICKDQKNFLEKNDSDLKDLLYDLKKFRCCNFKEYI